MGDTPQIPMETWPSQLDISAIRQEASTAYKSIGSRYQVAPTPPGQWGVYAWDYGPMSYTTALGVSASTVAAERDLWQSIESIPEIEGLWLDRTRDGVSIRLITNRLPDATRYWLYRVYRRWIETHPEILAELHVMDRRDTPVEQLVTPGTDTVRYDRARDARRNST